MNIKLIPAPRKVVLNAGTYHGMFTLVFQGSVQSGFLAFFGQDRDRTGLQKFPFWEKTEPDWEKPVYIGPVLDICQL